ncbi:MAG: hypothetical protein Fur0022_43670 [Anaerolineales bacterium]
MYTPFILWVVWLGLLAGCQLTSKVPTREALPTNSPIPTKFVAVETSTHVPETPASLPTATHTPTVLFIPSLTATSTEPPISSLTQPENVLNLIKIHMLDSNRGWAVDTQGRILRTTEGIQSWRDVSPPHGIAEDLFWPTVPDGMVAYFFDPDTAIVVYAVPPTPTTTVMFWLTADGAQNWQKGETFSLGIGGQYYSEGHFTPAQLFFLTKTHGWFLGQSFQGMNSLETMLLETIDGGFHWEKIEDSLQEAQTNGDRLRGSYTQPYTKEFMAFLDERTGFAGNGFSLKMTHDGGRSWQTQSLNPPEILPGSGGDKPWYYIAPPQFISMYDGTLLYRIYRLKQVEVPPGNIFYGLPEAHYIFYTHDGGHTWTPRPAPAQIGSVYFLNDQMGWFLGKGDSDPYGSTTLYFTQDGGETWTHPLQDTPLPLWTQLEFLDENFGFGIQPGYVDELDARADGSYHLFVTEDGGKTWTEIEPVLQP